MARYAAPNTPAIVDHFLTALGWNSTLLGSKLSLTLVYFSLKISVEFRFGLLLSQPKTRYSDVLLLRSQMFSLEDPTVFEIQFTDGLILSCRSSLYVFTAPLIMAIH